MPAPSSRELAGYRWEFDATRKFDAGPYEVLYESGNTYLVWPGQTVLLTPENAHKFGVEPVYDDRLKEESIEVQRRPSWDEFFVQQLPTLAARTTCDRGRSAAIFVRENDQVAAGYVGSPPGMPHCDDVGHLWDVTHKHCLRTIHAEQNAMIRALRHGISLRDTTVYCTMTPCYTCAKLMVGIGVYRVVCLNRYHTDLDTCELFADANVALVVIDNKTLYDPRGDDDR